MLHLLVPGSTVNLVAVRDSYSVFSTSDSSIQPKKKETTPTMYSPSVVSCAFGSASMRKVPASVQHANLQINLQWLNKNDFLAQDQ
jgi:hypothetical protein